MSDCVFCAIVAGIAPAYRIYEDDDTLAFLDIAPFTRGHTLVIPRDHHADLWNVPRETWQAVSATVHLIAERIQDRLDPDGLNLLQANRAIAFQTVFHLHVHVIPRWDADGISIPSWPKSRAEDGDLRELARELA